MDNQALARSEALRRRASPRVDSRLGLESRMLSKQPVRFGRGRLDSLARKGLAAYLITCCDLAGQQTPSFLFDRF